MGHYREYPSREQVNKERIACTEGGSCSGTPVEIQRSSVCYNALKMTFFNLNQAWCYPSRLTFC